MAISYPYSWVSGNLKEMSDTELEYLSYYLRLAWATGLSGAYLGSEDPTVGTAHHGAFYKTSGSSATSSDYTHLGNKTDTRKSAYVRTTQSDDYGYPPGPDDDDSFAAPDETTWDNTLATHTNNYFELFTPDHGSNPTLPNTAAYTADGYFIWNSSGNIGFQIEGTVANICDTIIKHANKEMLDGDELGTYRIATSAPSSDWTNMGTIYTDTIGSPAISGTTPSTDEYANVNVYQLYLKTSHTFTGTTTSTTTEPVGWDSSSTPGAMKQRSIVNTGNLVQNILIPIWKQNTFGGTSATGSMGYPRYKLEDSNSVTATHEVLRGTITDTYYTDSVARDYLDGGTYYKDRVGSGGSTSVNKYFILYFADANYVRS